MRGRQEERQAERREERKKKGMEGEKKELIGPPAREESRCGKFCNLNPMESQRQV